MEEAWEFAAVSGQIMFSLITPLVGLLGAILGAVLTKNRELDKIRRDLVSQAYASFVDAQSRGTLQQFEKAMVKFLQDEGLSEQEWKEISDVQKAYTSAHANLLIYGSPGVISALSAYYDVRGGAATEEGANAYVTLLRAMRADGSSRDYPRFGEDADNIFIRGPQKRQLALRQQFKPDET